MSSENDARDRDRSRRRVEIYRPRVKVLGLSLAVLADAALPRIPLLGSPAAAPPAFDGAPRRDQWVVMGPGGGGSIYLPTASPHTPNDLLAHCDMTGAYISHDGGDSWRMFNLRGRVRFDLFDPVDPKVIYVSTIGLWRSADRGETWRLVHPDPSSVTGLDILGDEAGERILTRGTSQGSISTLAVDPANSKILYAAFLENETHTFATSKDWGATWQRGGELPGYDAGSAHPYGGTPQRIFVDPSSPPLDRTLYFIGTNSISVRQKGTWRRFNPPPGVVSFNEFTGYTGGFPAGGGKPIFYVTSREGAFVSHDGGESWSGVSLPGIEGRVRFQGIAASFFHPEACCVSYDTGRRQPQPAFGFARTRDSGRTWTVAWNQSQQDHLQMAWIEERNGRGRNTEDVGAAPTDPNLVFGSDDMRIVRSSDGGTNWKAVYSRQLADGEWTSTGMDVTTCYGVHFDPFDKKRMFITYTDIGLMRSEDGGKGWVTSTTGVPHMWRNTTYWIVFDPQVKGRMWGVMSYVHDLPRTKMWNHRSVSTYIGGIGRSEDGGRNWTCNADWIPATAPTHILLDPRSPATARVLYVAAFGKGVYKTTDGGDHWVLKNNGISGEEPYAWRLAMDSRGVLYLLVARRNRDGSFDNPGDGALYRSDDGAEHWTRITLPKGVNGPNGLAIDVKDPRRLYLAAWCRTVPEGAKDGGIFLSDDAGKTWRNVLAKDQHVYDVTVDPRHPKVLYACGFESSAWRSSDRGETWQRIRGFNFKWGHRVIPDPYDPEMIYITTFGGSVWHGPATGDATAPEDIAGPPVLRYSQD